MHPQQIRIARNNHIRPPVRRHFHELIILRIVAFADGKNDGYKFCGMCNEPNKLQTLFDRDIAIKLGLRQSVGEFTHGRLRYEKNAVMDCLLGGTSGNRVETQESADEDVCVDDDALFRAHQLLRSSVRIPSVRPRWAACLLTRSQRRSSSSTFAPRIRSYFPGT